MTRAFMNQLAELRDRVLENASSTEELVSLCERVFPNNRNGELATLENSAEGIAARALSIETDVLKVIASDDAFGDDIHTLCVMLKVSSCFSRVARSTARMLERASALDEKTLGVYHEQLMPVLSQVMEIVRRAISAFRDRDVEVTRNLICEIGAVDATAREVSRKLFSDARSRTVTVTDCGQFFRVLNDLERIAGHARSVGSALVFRGSETEPATFAPKIASAVEFAGG